MNPSFSERAGLASFFRMRLARRLTFASHVWLWACLSLYGQDLPRFREHVITKELKFGYQLVVADLNGDGKKDLIAVDEAATQLAWFENQHPIWKRHVLATDVPRPTKCRLLGR